MKYNLNEVFEMAINVEKSGYLFYTNAALVLPEYSDFFTFLANEEVKHDIIFTGIKKDSISKEVFDSVWDPNGIISIYFDSLTGSTIFKKDKDIKELFKDVDSVSNVIEWAVIREHETILFFNGLKGCLESEADKKVVDDIIAEEITHVHKLMVKKSEILMK